MAVSSFDRYRHDLIDNVHARYAEVRESCIHRPNGEQWPLELQRELFAVAEAIHAEHMLLIEIIVKLKRPHAQVRHGLNELAAMVGRFGPAPTIEQLAADDA